MDNQIRDQIMIKFIFRKEIREDLTKLCKFEFFESVKGKYG